MRKAWFGLFLAALPVAAMAGHQMCGKQSVPNNVRHCPDGSIPMYVADEIQPARPAGGVAASGPVSSDRAGDGRQAQAEPGKPDGLFGVWRTRIPGAVWTSPSGYSGYDWLHVSAGVSVGDLIIRPDHTYVWNSYGGKKGKWVAGDQEYPIVLIDTVEHRQWKVGLDARHTGGRDIIIWDGNFYWYDGRK